MRTSGVCVSGYVLFGLFVASAGAVTADTVFVGNPGNPEDMEHARRYGAVAYAYRIGKYEVTAGQYSAFLNAVARTDAYGLYNTEMWGSEYGCKIMRSGSPGDYSYTVASDWADRPVNFVSWGDAARFANWMHNGQPASGVQDAATTEDGSYLLNGATQDSTLLAVTRKPDATWVIPTRSEWYKAAYHKNDGPTGNYWTYPTATDTPPSNDLGAPTDPGNNATFWQDDYTIGAPYWRTEAGAHENSPSPYGTFDQGGNVWEWDEAVANTHVGWMRGLSGGSFQSLSFDLHASHGLWLFPASDQRDVGFRLALVPEPATGLLFVLAGAAILRKKR